MRACVLVMLVIAVLLTALAAGTFSEVRAQVEPAQPTAPPTEAPAQVEPSRPFDPLVEVEPLSIPRTDFVGRLLERLMQPGRGLGWHLIPSIQLSERYDDNIFGTSGSRESDFITRAGASLSVGYLSPTFRLLAGYTVDAEFFASNSELNDVTHGGRGALHIRYPITPSTRVGLDASYRRTENTTDVADEEAGTVVVETGRRDVTVIQVAPSVLHRFDLLTSGQARYEFFRSEVSGEGDSQSHTLDLRLDREISLIDRAFLNYNVSVFGDGETDTAVAHRIWLGYERSLGPNTLASVAAGPLITDGDVSASGRAELRHGFEQGTVRLAYQRTQTVVIGLAGGRTVDTFSALAVFRPLSRLSVDFGAGVSLISEEEDPNSADRTVYVLRTGLSYLVSNWVTVRADYRFSYEDGAENIPHNVVTVTLDLSYPIRIGGGP